MKYREFVSAKQEQREADKISLVDFVSGDILTSRMVLRQLPFVLFCVLLMMLYIANQHQYVAVQREFGKLKKEVEVLGFKSMQLRTELMKYSRQSQVMERIEDRGLGLELSSEQPVVLKKE